MINKVDRIAIFTTLFVVIILQAGIYWNTKPQEEYKVIVATPTMDVRPLTDAGYFTIEKKGYIVVEEEVYHPIEPCPICEGIQSGDITLTSSDNFTIIMKEYSNNKLELIK